ncbi:MAG TPA: ribonuclease III family protein [Myxococcales bacterium]|nr:ribonuclease III family protein [Myxococcales bacterium]
MAFGYEFCDLSLLELVFIYFSYRNEHLDVEADNERLEFLGDSVLGAVVSHLLVANFPSQPEGVLTRYKAVLVSEQGLF